MTAQPPLNLVAEPGVMAVGPVADMVEDAAGGRVYVHGMLVSIWDAGDEGARRLAAVQLIVTKAAAVKDVAFAFGVKQPTLWRWRKQLADQGVAGLISAKRGPKGPSRVTPEVEADMLTRRAEGQTLQQIADATGVSISTVGRITNQEEPPVSQDTQPVQGGDEHPQATGDDERAGGNPLPVLPDMAPRNVERGLARAGVLEHARPLFTPAARVPLAGLFLALPALQATGLLACAKEVFGGLPNGFYGLDTTLLETSLRTLAGEPRAQGATRVDPIALGRVLGMDRAPEVKTIRRKLTHLATTGKSADLLAGMAKTKLAQNDAGGLAAVLYVDGHIRAYYGTRKIAKHHSTRLRFPAPATAETWVSDAQGDPVVLRLS